MSLKSPVLSIDCKKKERLGNLYRNGKCYCTKAVKVYDHDYEHLSKGKVIPHCIYDLQANKGYVSIGNRSETADFGQTICFGGGMNMESTITLMLKYFNLI